MSHTFIDVTVDNGLLLNVIPLCTSNQIQILKKNQSNAYVHDTTPTPTLYNHDRNSVSGWTKCVGSQLQTDATPRPVAVGTKRTALVLPQSWDT